MAPNGLGAVTVMKQPANARLWVSGGANCTTSPGVSFVSGRISLLSAPEGGAGSLAVVNQCFSQSFTGIGYEVGTAFGDLDCFAFFRWPVGIPIVPIGIKLQRATYFLLSRDRSAQAGVPGGGQFGVTLLDGLPGDIAPVDVGAAFCADDEVTVVYLCAHWCSL